MGLLLQAKERRKEREAQISKAQMDIAISGGVSWGMGGDAADDMDDDDEPAGGTVDWRMYSQTHTLTDKQQKIATKLRRLENRVMNLSRELERIRVSHCHNHLAMRPWAFAWPATVKRAVAGMMTGTLLNCGTSIFTCSLRLT